MTVAARVRPTRRHPTTGLPGVLVPLAVVAVLFLVVPIIGLLVRAPWGTIVEVLAREESLQALRLSLVCATLAFGLKPQNGGWPAAVAAVAGVLAFMVGWPRRRR